MNDWLPTESKATTDEIEQPPEIWTEETVAEPETVFVVPFTPDTEEETIRRSGIAWSLGIAFFVSVVFMLLLGWIADWLFGTKPWGLVAGIVFGSVIGFVQFFRASSQMYKKEPGHPEIRPLFDDRDDAGL